MNDPRKPIGLSQARQLLTTARGEPPSAQSVRLWASRGYKPRGWTGAPAVLRTTRLGNDLVTTPEWVAEFEAERWRMGEELRRAEIERAQRKAEPPRRSRKASQRAAQRYLDSMGCK